MKKVLFIIAPMVLVGFGLAFILFNSKKSNQPKIPLTQKETSKIGVSVQKPASEFMQPWSEESARNAKVEIPEEIRGATQDPAVVELMQTYQKSEIGKVVADNGVQRLQVGGKIIFEAQKIGDRTQAKDGTIALEAVTGSQTPISEAEVSKEGDGLKLVSSPREVWMVDLEGTKRKVSPSNVDAFSPVISPSGKLIAFTGRELDRNGLPSTQKVYVGDPLNGQYRTFQADKHLDNYQVTPIDWVENDTVLRVLQDYGETGGHMTLMKILWNN